MLCLQGQCPYCNPENHLIIHYESSFHGSTIYAEDQSAFVSSEDMFNHGMELLHIETTPHESYVYKPPPTPFQWPHVDLHRAKPLIAIGDF